MRRYGLLLVLSLGAPQLGWAQLLGNPFETGSYALAVSPDQRQAAYLKLQGSRLLVKADEGKTLRLKPEQVAAFRIGPRRYTVLHQVPLREGIGSAVLDHVFAEQLDSGQVYLLRVAYSFGAGMNGSYSGTAYVLQNGPAGPPVAAQGGGYSSGGRQFRDAVRPFLVSRPDLLQYLDEKRLTTANLPEAIRALNTQAPFTPAAF